MTKYINEHFFDKESKNMYYVLGAFYAGYVPQTSEGILFRNKNKGLVEIVKRELKSEHAIISDNRKENAYWVQVQGTHIMYSRLEKLGLNKPKTKRKFPKLKKKYMSHFIRGFFDARSGIWTRDNKYLNIHIGFNSSSFLSTLNKILVKYAKIHGGELGKDYTHYAHNDSIKIRDFIYQDWDYVRRRGIYLPSKKELLKTYYVADFSYCSRGIKIKNKVEKAKKLLKNKTVGEVSKILGYAQQVSFYTIFKKITGVSPFEYKTGRKYFRKGRNKQKRKK